MLVSRTSLSGKVMDKILLESISQSVKDRKAVVSSQHGREVKGKLRRGNYAWPSSVAFHNKVTGLVDDERAEDVVYCDFSKAFDTISSNICP